jgi:hypothetical protein
MATDGTVPGKAESTLLPARGAGGIEPLGQHPE